MQPVIQEITDRIKQVTNILVAVPADPTIDQLSAALALTVALDAAGKHSTAVFSGQIPNVMSFLKPEQTFENNVHSLRDFIISLNRDKADKLRFARDGEIVKIYITPYKSTITSQDLSYGEGDFNVEMVLAIGVTKKEDLDSVIVAHGKILHEATVATINTGSVASQLGSINWSDPTMTSSSAMITQLLGTLDIPGSVNEQVATALLTGIVSDTNRFSNPNTTPQVMELAAKLMQLGANNQLIASSITSAPVAAPADLKPLTVAQPPQDLTLELHEAKQVSEASTTQPVDQTITPAQNLLQPEMAPTELNTAPMVAQTFEAPQNPTVNQIAQPVDQTWQQPQIHPEQQFAAQPEAQPQLAPEPTYTEATPAQNYNDQIQPLEQSMQPMAEPQLTPTYDQPQVQPAVIEPANQQSTTSNNFTQPVEQNRVVNEDSIKSELDNLYAEADPVPEARADLGASPVIFPDEVDHTPEQSQEKKVSVDTSVQEAQNLNQNSITPSPVPAVIESTATPGELLGDTPAQQVQQIPGLEMPPEIPLPPPPPIPQPNLPGNNINFSPQIPK
jgi:hypothetical protein